MFNILISFIVPVYNVEKYISECLESIINQRLENAEIIIIDDASTDATKNKVTPYADKYGVRYFRNNVNKGVAYSRNEGLMKARGKFICFVDGDDYLNKDITPLMNMLIREIDVLIVKNYYTVNLKNKKNKFIVRQNIVNVNQENALLLKFLLGDFRGHAWRNFYRREFLISNNIRFNNNLVMGEDLAFNILVGLNRPKFEVTECPYYCYRDNLLSAMQHIEKRLKFSETIIYIKQIILDYGMLEKVKLEFEFMVFDVFGRFLGKVITNKIAARHVIISISQQMIHKSIFFNKYIYKTRFRENIMKAILYEFLRLIFGNKKR